MDYKKSIDKCYGDYNSSENGLSPGQAAEKLQAEGFNKLNEAKKKPLWLKFLMQFKDVMILVLIAAAVLSAVIGVLENSSEEFIDSAIIVIIVLVNAVIGLIQENKAEQSLESLKSMSTQYSKVMRGGVVEKVKAEELVRGDIVILESGDIVPADIRLTETASLQIQEAALTGESTASEKSTATLESDAPIGDRKNMAYSSGVVTYGRGKGIVTATGMNTEVGKIASMLESTEEDTPLQKKLNATGKYISIAVIGIAVVIFLINIFFSTAPTHGNKYVAAFMTSVAIAVAAIPEGLPVVVTIVMAMGVTRLSKKNAIIRRLHAVETLGCTEIICSDKTGTLTLNKMTVKKVVTIDNEYSGVIAADAAVEVLNCMVLCNDTALTVDAKGAHTVGDPTETALVDYAYKCGVSKIDLDVKYPRVDERPFDSVRKLMSTVNTVDGKSTVYTKGACDELLNVCSHVLDGGKVRPITAKDKEYVSAKITEMASTALRVLGYAVSYDGQIESGMIFVGMSGMIDPPRDEAKNAIKVCKKAGMTAIMITGDHRDTAVAIAKELGMIKGEGEVITGKELDALSDEEYEKTIKKYRVYARVSPENKVRIVKTWKKLGKIVAMTGDGVNDAPSIKSADIGIGMGITGTDVTKSIADMVLTDDNFATIVVAVEEGRKIYNNIEKAIQFLMSANIAEVLSLLVASLFFPFLSFLIPVQILWVNLVTDSFPALALGVEKTEKDIMDNPPRESKGSLFHGALGINILWQGIAQGILVLASFLIGAYMFSSTPGTPTTDSNLIGTTMAFSTLCLIQLFHSFNTRSSRKSLFKMHPFSNPILWGAFGLGAVLTVCVVMIPFLNPVFGTTGLSLSQWGFTILFAVAIIPIAEIGKLIQRLITKGKTKNNSAE